MLTRPILMACPRISPEWELAALRALMKPQLKGAILHRPAHQHWPADAADRLRLVRHAIFDRIGFDPNPHLPPDGDYHLVCGVHPRDSAPARAFSLALSRQFAGIWFVLGHHCIRDGQFWRRRHGTQLRLAPATSIHLPRALRTALRGWV